MIMYFLVVLHPYMLGLGVMPISYHGIPHFGPMPEVSVVARYNITATSTIVILPIGI